MLFVAGEFQCNRVQLEFLPIGLKSFLLLIPRPPLALTFWSLVLASRSRPKLLLFHSAHLAIATSLAPPTQLHRSTHSSGNFFICGWRWWWWCGQSMECTPSNWNQLSIIIIGGGGGSMSNYV